MAYRKRTQYRRRRQYRGRKRSRYGGRKWFKRKMRSTRQVVRGPAGILSADRYFTKLKYSTVYNAADASTALGYYNSFDFRGNGPYDPEAALGGGQPYGFDQLAAIYQRYRCYASKIRVKVHNLTGSSTTPYFMAVFPYATGAAPTDAGWYVNAAEQPYSRYVTRNAFDSSPTLKSVMSTAKIYGVNKTMVKSDTQFQSLVSTTPSYEWFWKVSFGQISPTVTSANTFNLQIDITYYMEFFDRAPINRS